MLAQVVSGSITSFPKGNKGIVVGDVKHPKTIFTLWTEAERNAIGVYTVELNKTNKKDEYDDMKKQIEICKKTINNIRSKTSSSSEASSILAKYLIS